MAHRQQSAARIPPANIQEQEDQPWKPNNVVDDFWGPDETEYWAAIEAEKKALAKMDRTSQPKPRKVEQLTVEVMEWEQPDDADFTLLNDVKNAHKEQPKSPTYTVVNPKSDPDAPETKRRIFANLHKQLVKEADQAAESGGAMRMPEELWKEILGHAGKAAEDWEDVDVALFELRVRELVRLLIVNRRETAVAG